MAATPSCRDPRLRHHVRACQTAWHAQRPCSARTEPGTGGTYLRPDSGAPAPGAAATQRADANYLVNFGPANLGLSRSAKCSPTAKVTPSRTGLPGGWSLAPLRRRIARAEQSPRQIEKLQPKRNRWLLTVVVMARASLRVGQFHHPSPGGARSRTRASLRSVKRQRCIRVVYAAAIRG
jgi:hypothetical protein